MKKIAYFIVLLSCVFICSCDKNEGPENPREIKSGLLPSVNIAWFDSEETVNTKMRNVGEIYLRQERNPQITTAGVDVVYIQSGVLEKRYWEFRFDENNILFYIGYYYYFNPDAEPLFDAEEKRVKKIVDYDNMNVGGTSGNVIGNIHYSFPTIQKYSAFGTGLGFKANISVALSPMNIKWPDE